MSITGWSDELRRAVRALAKRPAYASVAIATLALGIGASVAIFAVVDSVLLRPLPYPESDRIVVVAHHAPGLNLPDLANSDGTADFYRHSAHQITPLAAVSRTAVNLTGRGPAERITVARVSPQFFSVMATQPVRGRAFNDLDVSASGAPVVILSYATWQSRFAGSAAALDSSLELDGARLRIIGVMPRDFAYPDPGVQAYLPMFVSPQLPFGTFGQTGLARLAPGATLASATAELTTLQARIPDRFPGVTKDFLHKAGWSATMTTLRDVTVHDIAPTLWVLLGGVGLVLLIATANVANLFLVRSESRGREMALRTALGAGRARMVLTFLSESVVIGAAGGLLGATIAWGGVRFLVAHGPPHLPRLTEVSLNGDVLMFAALVTIVAGVAIGALPIVTMMRRTTAAALREGGRNATAGRERHRVRKTLIAAQVAMSLVLLVSAELMFESVRHLHGVDPGFRSAGVLAVDVSLEQTTTTPVASRFYHDVVDAIVHVPGVTAAGVTNSLPIDSPNSNGSSFAIQSRPPSQGALPPVARYAAVTPGYFDAMHMAVERGRGPDWHDAEGKPRAIWVNETFAHRFLGGHVIGEHLRFGTDTVWSEVVGVVNDVRTSGLRSAIPAMAYYPIGVPASGLTLTFGTIVLHTAHDPAALAPAVREIVQRANGAVPVTSARTMDEVIASSLAQISFTMVLLSVAAVVAVALGVVGLYGVISYVVGQRTNEIGVRMALGARPSQVRAMILRQGATLTLGGVAIGLVAATALTRLMNSLLFDVSARDPLMFALSAVVLAGVSVVAADVPARRAAAVEPLAALRSE